MEGKRKITLGSLFDGSGGFPLAAAMCGITPVWASEIEKFPMEVTAKRFPDMKHLGDIRKINGADISPVDIITFGSPCQDLSVAGNQKGLSGERSGLFLEAVRIIKEMRDKTNGIYPAFAVWENVPGAFSSNKGEDFRTVLKEMCGISGQTADIPGPPGGTWNTCGSIMGDGFSIAWRVLDAQYWGVPQRRRRIFLVADLRGGCAAEILFKRGGLSRNFTEGFKAWKKASASAESCTGISEQAVSGMHVSQDVLFFDADQITSKENRSKPKINAPCHTITSSNAPCLCYSCGNGQADNSTLSDKMQTLSCMHDQQAVLLFDNQALDSRYDGPLNVSPTMKASYGTGGNNQPLCLSIAGNTIDRKAENGGNGKGYQEDVSYTLNTMDRHVVADIERWKVRRLMPVECCRLQGFPDWWCEDVPHSDSAEYKMWGNGVALPCVLYIMEGIAETFGKGINVK